MKITEQHVSDEHINKTIRITENQIRFLEAVDSQDGEEGGSNFIKFLQTELSLLLELKQRRAEDRQREHDSQKV